MGTVKVQVMVMVMTTPVVVMVIDDGNTSVIVMVNVLVMVMTMLVTVMVIEAIDCKGASTGVPGIYPPPWSRFPGAKPHRISPSPRGQIPRDLALPARPPLGMSPPPPLNDTFQRIFLYLDLATKKSSEIWFGTLFDNGFARVRLRANVVWYFQKLELTS